MLALALAGCAATADAEAGDDGHAQDHEITSQADDFGIHDAWVKAATVADGMTSLFGDIHTHTEQGLEITGATSEAAAIVEFHEFVEDSTGTRVMRAIEGPFKVSAGPDVSLEPGGHHVMLIDLREDLEPGATVTVTFTFSDGSESTFDAVVKEFAGAEESYEHDSGDHDHGSH